MAAPIIVKEALTLGSVGINQEFITSSHVTMDSDKYICVMKKNCVVIIDVSMRMNPLSYPINADSALMNPNGRMLAFKAQLPRTTCDCLQIFDIELMAMVKLHEMPQQVVFWKWITPNILGLITKTSVYQWSIDGDSKPAKMFDRTTNLTNNQIINYCCDPSEKWLVLIGIAPGSRGRPQLLKGNMQLFSVDQQKSESFEAHAASFASFKVAGNENPSTLICFASKTTYAGQIISKMHVIELLAQPEPPSFAKKQVDLSFPSDFADDFPVGMQISQKYSLIYVITKFGLLFVYDLETATAIYQNRISSVPIFLTTQAFGIGGFYAVNRTGQVLQATVNEATIVPFVSGQVVVRFQELLFQAEYKMAVELAVESPGGLLRTPETFAKFQSVPVQSGQTPLVLQYFALLLKRGKLNAFESLELSHIVVKENKMNLLENWLAEDKLELSEELGDLVKTVNSDLALKIYIKAKLWPKVVEQKEFDKILIYSKQVGYTPDYSILLQTMLSSDPQGSLNFALMMSQMEGGCPIDYDTITDLFLQKNLVQEATAFLLEVLKPNLPEHGFLQTKVLEINLATYPNVADDILANGIFSHYDRPRIDQLREKAMRVQQLEQSNPAGLKTNSHDNYNEGRGGQSYRTTSEEEQAECSDGSKISNVRGEWSSLEISFSDIVNATNNFCGSSMIGKGGYGTVYKGKHGKATVAIKMLDSTSKQGQKEFFQELEVLYRIWHPNLVKLVGACFEVQALVYEFLPNGSLGDCLKDSPNLLTWQMRTRIVYEISLALLYLHSKSIVHGDLKPANILLDSNFKSKLADFGLCRILPEDMTTVYHETVPKGTLGYIDPWFYETGILRPGSDLYSFGITILNLLTGLPPIGLGTKARDADEKLFREMIDPTAGNWPFELAKELLYWSSQCCYHNEHSLQLLEDMSISLEDMLAEIETFQQGRSKVVARRKTAAQDPFKVEKKKEEPVVIMVLKVDMHSEAYAQEIKAGIQSMKGVHTVTSAFKASEVSVMGVFNPLELIEYVRKKTNKNVAIVDIEQVDKKPKEESLKEEEEPKDGKINEKEEKDLLLHK